MLPVMRAQGGGRIVLISSIGGVLGIPFQAFYSASKFALEGYGEALRPTRWRPPGIGVTLVQPGNIRTDFTASRRMAAAAEGDGIYGAAVARAVGLMERDEFSNGALLAACRERGRRGPAGAGRTAAAAEPAVLVASVGKAGERTWAAGRKRVLHVPMVFEAWSAVKGTACASANPAERAYHG